MDSALRSELAGAEDRHWWFEARRQIIAGILTGLPLPPHARILEAGCGNGANLEMLSGFGAVTGIEPDPQDLARAQARNIGRVVEGSLPDLPLTVLPDVPLTVLPDVPPSEQPDVPPSVQPDVLPSVQPDVLPRSVPPAATEPATFRPEHRYDVALALDVIEHIDEDVESVRALLGILAPAGYLIVTVPGHQWLWSQHDERNDHRRRYSRRSLRRTLLEAGATVERVTWFNSRLFLPVVLTRTLGKLIGADSAGTTVPRERINRALTRVMAGESGVLARRDQRMGISLLAIAQNLARSNE